MSSSRKRWLALIGLALLLGCLAFVAWRLLTGQGLGLWRIANVGQAVLHSASVKSASSGDFTNVIFVHHSVGQNLIEQGGVRQKFSEAGYSFWDHDYHWGRRLTDPDGRPTGYSYSIPNDNTDPDGLATIFGQKEYPLPLNALSGLLQHQVIAFKSCYPASRIDSDEQLAQYKTYYLEMREVMDRHPEKIFIVVTPPPVNPAGTTPQAAARARAFADWLKSGEYLAGHPNVFVFDFFDYLAEDDPAAAGYNMLREPYQQGTDSHPNQLANETIGPLFVDFIIEATQQYRAIYKTE